MQNSFLKLTALAGVIGIGFLVVLQTQRGLSRPVEEQATEVAAEDGAASADLAEQAPEFQFDEPVDLGQNEPQDVPEFGAEQPAAKDNPFADSGKRPEEQHNASLEFGHGAERKNDSAPGIAAVTPASAEVDSATGAADEDGTAEPAPARGLDFRDEFAEVPEPVKSADEPDVSGPMPSDPDDTDDAAAAPPALPFVELAHHTQAGDGDKAQMSNGAADVELTGGEDEPAPAGPQLLGPAAPGPGGANPFSEDFDPFGEADPPAQNPATVDADSEPAEMPLLPAEGPDETPNDDADSEPAMTAPPLSPFAPEPDPGAFDASEDAAAPAAADEPRTDAAPAIVSRRKKALTEEELDRKLKQQLEPEQSSEPIRPSHRSPSHVTPEESPGDGQTHEDQPNPLQPAPDAAMLVPTPTGSADAADSADSLDVRGDGILDPRAPRGPQQPQLEIQKSAPPNAILGQPLVYHILVRNVGSSSAYQVTVEDRIPRGVKLSGTIPRAELSGTKLLWQLGELKSGEERKIAVRVVPVAEGAIGSVATVNFVAEVAAQTLVTAPNLQLELRAPKQANMGEPVVFQFRVANNGTGNATGVVIRNAIPAGLRHPDGNELEYEIGTLPAGQTREIKLALTAARVGAVVNRAVATADGGLTSQAEATLEVLSNNLKVSRTGPPQNFLGRPSVFENTVTNHSDQTIADATVVENLAEGMEFISASNGGQYNPNNRQIAWRIDQLGPGESTVLRVTLLPRALGPLTSVVKAFDPTGAPAETIVQTKAVGVPQISVEVTAQKAAAAVGSEVTYGVVIRNRGTSIAQNVRVKALVPAQMQLVSVHGPLRPTRKGSEIFFAAIDELAPEGEVAFQMVLRSVAPGEAHLKVLAQSAEMDHALSHEAVTDVTGP